MRAQIAARARLGRAALAALLVTLLWAWNAFAGLHAAGDDTASTARTAAALAAVRLRQAGHRAALWAGATLLRERPAGYVHSDAACVTVWSAPSELAAAREVAARTPTRLRQVAVALGLSASDVEAACRRAGPVQVILYDSPAALARAYDLDPAHAPEGLYRHGVIGLLGPATWGDGAAGLEAFWRHGALVHELAHWLLDVRAGGNVPAWLHEGLAQLADARVTGFVWLPDVRGPAHDLARLEHDFDRLDPARAYREALWLVLGVEREAGRPALGALVRALGDGLPFPAALHQATGLDRADLAGALAAIRWQEPPPGLSGAAAQESAPADSN